MIRALVVSLALAFCPLTAAADPGPDRPDAIAAAVANMPLPSLRARLRSQAAAQAAVERLARQLGFGDRPLRVAGLAVVARAGS